jgi:hypothetical protein
MIYVVLIDILQVYSILIIYQTKKKKKENKIYKQNFKQTRRQFIKVLSLRLVFNTFQGPGGSMS